MKNKVSNGECRPEPEQPEIVWTQEKCEDVKRHDYEISDDGGTLAKKYRAPRQPTRSLDNCRKKDNVIKAPRESRGCKGSDNQDGQLLNPVPVISGLPPME